MRFPTFDSGITGINSYKSRPPLTRQERKRVKSAQIREQRDRAAWRGSKHHSITPELVSEFVQLWGSGEALTNPEEFAAALTGEHRVFANIMTPAELEQFSHQTVVGIGEYYHRSKNKGFVLVLNELKKLSDGALGLGFPGGRVRLGESPDARLGKEYLEESGLVCEVVNPDQPPVAEHKVGEEEHRISAYEIRITGGKPQPNPTKDEPIIAVVFVDKQTLKLACQNDGRIAVKIGRRKLVVGVLRSHRILFLEYLRGKEAQREAEVIGMMEEVANV